METIINKSIELFTNTISFANDLLSMMLKKKEKKEKQTEILKQIIYNQRCLKYVCKKNYYKEFFIDYENKISDFLKTFFDDEMASCFIKGNIDIYWLLRYGSEIKDEIIEKSLEEFINICKSRKYNIQ